MLRQKSVSAASQVHLSRSIKLSDRKLIPGENKDQERYDPHNQATKTFKFLHQSPCQ